MNEEISTFFEYGRVELKERDSRSREAQLDICIPCTLLLAISPSLLGNGLIDDFRIREPIAIWIPKLTDDRFFPVATQQVPLLSEKANSAIKQSVDRIIQNYQDLSQILQFPGDIAPMLPLGLYVSFTYRCKIDSLASIILGIERTPHHGIAEFRYAIAKVLNLALNDIEKWGKSKESNRLTRI